MKELLNYLKNKNIVTNISEQDVENHKRIDEIINSIIVQGMTDKEKIQAICLYVLDNLEYDISKTLESNCNSLNCVLEDGTGVCVSYAYFTNILLTKAGSII